MARSRWACCWARGACDDTRMPCYLPSVSLPIGRHRREMLPHRLRHRARCLHGLAQAVGGHAEGRGPVLQLVVLLQADAVAIDVADLALVVRHGVALLVWNPFPML